MWFSANTLCYSERLLADQPGGMGYLPKERVSDKEDQGESGVSIAAFVDPFKNSVLATTALPVDVGGPAVLTDAIYFPGHFGATAVVVDRETWGVFNTRDGCERWRDRSGRPGRRRDLRRHGQRDGRPADRRYNLYANQDDRTIRSQRNRHLRRHPMDGRRTAIQRHPTL